MSTPLPPPHSFPDQPADIEADLGRYGITRVSTDSFEVHGYRYSNAKDAIAQAKRQDRAK